MASGVQCTPDLPNHFCEVTRSYCDITNPLILISFMREHEVIMSPIVACSVASLYGCKPNDIFSKRLLHKFLGGRPITETTGIIF